MAKKPEYDMTPLQVAQVAAERHSKFDAWAASVASTIVASSLGEKLLEKMQKNNLVELTKLENSIAQHLVVCSIKVHSPLHGLSDEQKLSSWENSVDKQGGSFSPEEILASKEWR